MSRRVVLGAGLARVAGCAFAAVTLAVSSLPAQSVDGDAAPADAREARGFTGPAAATQAAVERVLVETIQPDSAARWARGLAARSHVAGTPGQVATRDSVVGWLRGFGIEVAYDSLVLYLPQPLETSLEQLAPVTRRFALDEPALPGTEYEHVPAFNAFSGSGTAEGPVVYANYGLPEDYAVLDSLGIEVAGRIVLARYGRSFRGIKAREAESRGAAGLLMFSDPSADGFGRGPVLPDGPQRPPRGVQRGSILNADGDPSTPGRPSLPGAPRVPPDEMDGVSRIPVLPIGYGTAEQLLRELDGPAAPEGWAGALDVGYRPGPGPTTVRLTVRTETGDAAYHPAFNTIAAIRGTTWPDEWVLVGAHRDSWGPGAVDNVSGTASVIEAARAFAAAAARGLRPRRTVVFATWDAEEWGILGSTEWVEANADRLDASGVAYINQDSPVGGTRFGAAAAPEIRVLVRDATRAVRDPDTGRPLYDVWLSTQRESEDATPLERPSVGTMGGGSDHLPFYIHLGIPSAGFGFGGQGGVYHSMYDTSEWMERYGDPGYRYHAATARLSAVVLSRLANADVVPYDHAALAGAFRTQLAGFAAELDQSGLAVDSADSARLAAVRAALDDYEAAAVAFERAVESRLASGGLAPSAAGEINESQRRAIRALLRPAGGEWARNLYVRDDPDNGYSAIVLPGLRLAVRTGDADALVRELDLLADRFAAATARLSEARAATDES